MKYLVHRNRASAAIHAVSSCGMMVTGVRRHNSTQICTASSRTKRSAILLHDVNHAVWFTTAHYERDVSDLYDIANVIELYVMSAYGEERKAVHIFNKYDSGARCGEFYQTYEESVKLKISQLGKGTFDTYLDDTHKEHIISDHGLTVILKQMIT